MLLAVTRLITYLLGEKRETEAESSLFRVLLLTTEKDLGETREQVAIYLHDVLGMKVISEVDEKANSPDLVVLIQAWRWEEGNMIQAWEAFPEEKRLLFMIREDAPWAPSLIEFSSIHEIKAFRKCNFDSILFNQPDELPGLIGKITDSRRKHSGLFHDFPGLREIERTYLEMRLAGWKQGRAGDGRIHSAVDDIFNQYLYISMDGLSERWRLDDNGQTVYRSNIDNKEMLRLPLAAWVSFEEMSRIILSGSPGTGKTVFLTRFAAALAEVLLGQGTTLEQNLSLEGLSEDGRPPIPIVLEAVHLAHNTIVFGLDRLANAVRTALIDGCTEQEAPNSATIISGLRNGRYLIMVDALDEIPNENMRRACVSWLKGLSIILKRTRFVLTTRSAQYTGPLAYGPEFEVLEIAGLNVAQQDLLIDRFRDYKEEPERFNALLHDAVASLKQRLAGGDERDLAGNPLMLTTICAVYYKVRRLPNDRAELCDLIVEDLCRAKSSRDRASDWELDFRQKRDLLERLALDMQEKGAQSLPLADACQIIAAGLAPDQARERKRIDTYLKWLVQHTGLIYYRPDGNGEAIRFHHRLFREFLAASRLTGENETVETLVEELLRKGFLADTFWSDVIRLLPGTMNRVEKAKAMAEHLEELANRHPDQEGRLRAILSATLVESTNLFRLYDIIGFTRRSIERYEVTGKTWTLDDRRLFLDGLAVLGDPRLGMDLENRWVYIKPGRFTMERNKNKYNDDKLEHTVHIEEGFWLGRFPVTNQEYAEFLLDGGFQREELWHPEGWKWLHMDEQAFDAFFNDLKKQFAYIEPDWKQFYRPDQKPFWWNDRRMNRHNQPVVGINWFEAYAYCCWLTQKWREKPPGWFQGEVEISLPFDAEWEYAARGSTSVPYPWGNEEPGKDLANFNQHVGETTPVGAYPLGNTPRGLIDMSGNVWEWCFDPWNDEIYPKRKDAKVGVRITEGDPARRTLHGGSWSNSADKLRSSCRFRASAWSRVSGIGFRCCCRLVVRSSEHG